MNKVCKIRCYPTQTQLQKINQIFGGCRYVMNLYIEYNNKSTEFISGYDFAKIINKVKKKEDRFEWLNHISTKALKDSIMAQEKAYKNFFRKRKNGGTVSSPKFKSRKRLNKESFFFIKDSIHFDTGKKNVIKIPILKNIRITGRDSLPDKDTITSGRLIREYDKYYLIFIYESRPVNLHRNNIGLGIDVGVKTYATISTTDGDSLMFDHFKDFPRYKEIIKKIEDYQRVISKKAEMNYGRLLNQYLDKHPDKEISQTTKNIMKGESYNTSQIKKMRKKINRLYQKKSNIRKDFIDKLVYFIVVRTKPEYITIEDLSVKNMLENDSNHSLHKYIAESGFYYFRTHLTDKCHEFVTELRIALRYFASSKTCSRCGHKLKSLTLNDRVYQCPKCGLVIDRDLNASINLTYTDKYSIA